jgi:hypothetical protein
MKNIEPRKFIVALIDWLWKTTLKPHDDYLVVLSDGKIQKGSMFSVVNPWALWNEETLRRKIAAVITNDWSPSNERIVSAAKKALFDEVFGEDEDYGPELFRLMHWHGSREWNNISLTEKDQTKADALATYTIATRKQFRRIMLSNPSLNLQLKLRSPQICLLVYPMVVKVPIVSIRYFLEIDVAFTFHSVRSANHPNSDGIISYLYEILFLQQKTALSLLDYLTQLVQIREEKRESLLVKAELYGIMRADLLVTYLKATIEKILALVATVFQIDGLDTKKTNKAKIEALDRALPSMMKETYYGDFLLEMVKSENMIELNNYRTGLLHKKGIAVLQPHSYVGLAADSIPNLKVFQLLHEQHAKNTAGFLAALAMLTDDLVKRAPLPDAMDVWLDLQKIALKDSFETLLSQC